MTRTTREALRQATFWNHCAEVAAVLDEASRYGSAPGLEARYQLSRAWLLTHYGEYQAITKPLLPPTDRGGNRMVWGEPGDVFQQLFSAPTAQQAVLRLGRDLSPSLAAAWALLDAREALATT